MTTLTKQMIDAFPVANLHIHLPGCISPEIAFELGLRNKLIRIENGKIIGTTKLPVPDDVRYKSYADIFASGYEIAADGQPQNLRYDITPHSTQTFNEFDQIMAIVHGHRYNPFGADGRVIQACGGIQKPEDVQLVLDRYLENCKKAGVKYVELQQNIFLSEIIYPHLSKRDSQQAFFEILAQAQRKFADAGISLFFAQCFNKSSMLSSEDEAIARANSAVDDLLYAQELHPNLFIKLNSAGNEKVALAHPKYQHEAYAIAGQNGIALDCHAAEANHAQMLIDTVEQLGVGIIGHGFQVVESPKAMHFAAERDLIFMVCPSMNMFLGANLALESGKVELKTIWQHPFWQMLREPVEGRYLKVSLATDNPDLGGVPYKVMLMQLAGLLPEMTGYAPENFKPLSAEELYRTAQNGLDAIPNLSERMGYEHHLNGWARASGLTVERYPTPSVPFSQR